MAAGGEGIISSNGIATRGLDGKKDSKGKKGRGLWVRNYQKEKSSWIKEKKNRGERCGLPLGPSGALRTRAANPAAASPARGPHLARGRPGSVQQRRLLVRLPRPSKKRRRLLIIAVSAGPRHLFRDVGHGPLRTKLRKNSRPPGSVPVTPAGTHVIHHRGPRDRGWQPARSVSAGSLGSCGSLVFAAQAINLALKSVSSQSS